MCLNQLIYDTFRDCIDLGFTFYTPFKNSHQGCKGYVDSYNKKFVTCTKDPGWESTFVHESCHLDQYKENINLWYDPIFYNGDFTVNKLKKQIRKELIQKTMQLEIDCDIRAVKKIKKYNLNIDLSEYIASSNCYHHSHYYFYKLKCYYNTKKVPFNNKTLLEHFNNKEITPFKTKWAEHFELRKFLKKYNKPL